MHVVETNMQAENLNIRYFSLSTEEEGLSIKEEIPCKYEEIRCRWKWGRVSHGEKILRAVLEPKKAMWNQKHETHAQE